MAQILPEGVNYLTAMALQQGIVPPLIEQSDVGLADLWCEQRIVAPAVGSKDIKIGGY